MEKKTNNFEELFVKALNFEIPKEKIETIKDKSNNTRPLSYISWAYAWGMFKQIYTDATYKIIKNPETNLPYFSDPDTGIMVYTSITAAGETHEMWLFVMDSSNNAMKLKPYTYQKWNSFSKSFEEKTVKAATMFDINKTLLRCLVKNMAIFGFALNIYNGDDLPEFNLESDNESALAPTAPKRTTRKAMTPSLKSQPQPQPQPQYDRYAGIRQMLSTVQTVADLVKIWNEHRSEVEGNDDIKALFTARKNELTFNAA